MSAGGARRGRRDNGLDAAEFAVAGDVDPRVGEHLLDVLAAGGIAAYLQPSSDINPVTRTTTMPSRPTDRLFVDRAHLTTARDYLARLADDDEPAPGGRARGAGRAGRSPAEPPGPDMDAEWERIVAGFHAEVDPAARPWPAVENVDPRQPDAGDGPAPRPGSAEPTGRPGARGPAGDPTGPGPLFDDPTSGLPGPTGAGSQPASPPETPGTGPDGVERRRRPRPASGEDEPSLLDGLDTFGAHLPDDDDDRYVPPPPPPLPKVSKYALAAVSGIVGGFVLFLFPELIPIDNNVVMLSGFAGVLAGFVTLIWRLRPGDEDDDDDPDQGAVV